MAPWLLALIGGQRRLVSQTFNANGTFTAPFGVSKVNLSGKGAPGTAAYSSTRTDFAQGDSVSGSATGSGPSSGSGLSWSDFQPDPAGVLADVNRGGGGSGYVVTYTAYPNTNTYSNTLYQYTYSNAVPGTASVFLSPGWKTSGPILASDYGYFQIQYTQTYTVDATTGASTTGFGRTFAGGAGGPATVTTFNDVTVTENTAYPVTVPSGGSLTITYYQ